ncbi:rifin PIR protein, putative [Plasmodium reichenowi]|uniref:Rifin PIR protein, putative n=1 Tax=Plasmodium reichenowi TaxID=5854 RepID=A0A2P9D4R2_PLARE|nr:rifin PIR protein, putative [Plasmodium reichenowi]
MKLHCSKILLLFLPLNILVTSYEAYNKNKPSITPHHTQTNRSLCESDTESSIYDNDREMKEVMENFDRRTSQRFEEYEERMKDKRQKRKEQRDRNIQEIVEKDKREKSLAQKVEIGCLGCGCALGGGVLPVWGLVSGLWYGTWSQYVAKMATDAGIKAGIYEAIEGVKSTFDLDAISGVGLDQLFTAKTFKDQMFFVSKIYGEYNRICDNGTVCSNNFFTSIKQSSGGNPSEVIKTITQSVRKVATKADQVSKDAEIAAISAENAKSPYLFSAIGYSVLAILIIVLVMIIIYLVLRYRRKKKMNKKAQYTELLQE